MYTRDTELRRLQSNDVNRLAEALGFDGGRKLMETIPKHWTNQNGGSHRLNGDINSASVVELKYRPEQIRLIEEATRQTSGCYFAEILIQEWSTSGRKHERPTVGLLLHLLIKADLWNAADFVAEHFLNEPAPERPLEGPGAKVDISIPSECLGSVVDFVNDSNGYPDTEALNVNANSANNVADHNRDYYMKFSHFSKDIINGAAPKPPPRAQRAARQQNLLHQQQQQQQQQQIMHNRQPSLQRTQINNDVVVGTTLESNDHNQSKQETHENLHSSFSKQQELQQQNLNSSISNSNMTAHNIPELSDLLQVANSSQQLTFKSEEEVANNAPMLSLLECTTNSSTTMSGTLHNNSTPAVIASSSSTSNVIVPKSSSISNSYCDSLPLITELNLDNTSAELINNIDEAYNNSRQQQIPSPNASSDGSRCSSLSNDSFDDDDEGNDVNGMRAAGNDADNAVDGDCGENSLPNLSVFGRQSPNNDSSLTTVTCTSGDNSFELSFNESSSTSTTDPTAQRK